MHVEDQTPEPAQKKYLNIVYYLNILYYVIKIIDVLISLYLHFHH